MTSRIPVTVLTGFLGSGKTTLLNRILHENHGQRIAVIENEFGEIGVDQDLVINANEEIFEMNNGCICCTVRGDLIRILGNLIERKDKFDRVILETTGMADPGPVAQTFFLDQNIKDAFILDGIITLVDAKHVHYHWHESEEVQAQIAFADLILLNKIDLVSQDEQKEITRELQKMNKMAKVLPVHMGSAPLETLLNIGGFDLDRALEANPQFLQPEYPFEWAGIYKLDKGRHQWHTEPGPDPEMSFTIEPCTRADEETLHRLAEATFPRFAYPPELLQAQQIALPLQAHWALDLSPTHAQHFVVDIPASGYYAFFTPHRPDEFNAQLMTETGTEITPLVELQFNGGHEHDESIGSVAFEFPGLLDLHKFETWLDFFLKTNSSNIFRMKGIVAIKDEPNRFIFQGVHMLFEAREGKAWGDEMPFNRMVFIGRELNKSLIEGAFRSCLL
jgi:G3E family GTPase